MPSSCADSWRSSASRWRPDSGRRTRSSRPALDKGGTSGWILGIVALAGAGLTAFYMTRALVMTFHGERRWEEDVHPHEAPRLMTIPMIILGVLSLVGGYVLIFGPRCAALAHAFRRPVDRTGRDTVSPVVLSVITLVVVRWAVLGGWVAFGGGRFPRHPAGGRLAGTTPRPPQAVRRHIQRDHADEAGSVAQPTLV